MKKIVALTGAGISAESGIQTFRGAGGLWEGHRVEDVASPQGWQKDPAMVLDFYNVRRQAIFDATPNEGHLVLAALEQHAEVIIVTQNIDDLHERAGSTNVLHLHGEIFKARSTADESLIYDIRGKDILPGDRCELGSQLRPHIVWFGEPVPMIEVAASVVQQADIFVIVGTSLAVYPAAGLTQFAPDNIPKYVIDPFIPKVPGIEEFNIIEYGGSEGMTQFSESIKALL